MLLRLQDILLLNECSFFMYSILMFQNLQGSCLDISSGKLCFFIFYFFYVTSTHIHKILYLPALRGKNPMLFSVAGSISSVVCGLLVSGSADICSAAQHIRFSNQHQSTDSQNHFRESQPGEFITEDFRANDRRKRSL